MSSQPTPVSQPSAEAGCLRLDELEPGRCGKIVRINSDSRQVGRLAGMGVCVGRVVQMVKPGDPMVLRAFGARIGLSYRLGQQIAVMPCSDSNCIVSEQEQCAGQ